MGLGGREREIVSALIETKAVDFEAIGSAFAKFGPSIALDMDYEDGFCGTMRYFVHLYRPQFGGSLPSVEELAQAVGKELRS